MNQDQMRNRVYNLIDDLELVLWEAKKEKNVDKLVDLAQEIRNSGIEIEWQAGKMLEVTK